MQMPYDQHQPLRRKNTVRSNDALRSNYPLSGSDSVRGNDPLSRSDTLRVRSFGQDQLDLEVDFQRLSGPALVTEILACCAEGIERERLWDLEIGQRLAALIRTAVGSDQSGLDLLLKCQNPDCGQNMEVNLALEDLAEIERQAATVNLQVGGRPNPIDGGWGEDFRLSLRRPTGCDQLAWQAAAAAGHSPSIEEIVRGLVIDPPGMSHKRPIPGEILRICEEKLDAADPLVNFVFSVNCPYCRAIYNIPVDLQAAALGLLRLTQARLLRVIHTLAGHYHWTESEILGLPEWRRGRYLALVEEEQEAKR